MPKIARSDIVVPNKLDPAARQGFIDALYKVHCEVFDGVSRDSFAKYVVESQAENLISAAKVYTELIGYGVSSNANHITEPIRRARTRACDADGVRRWGIDRRKWATSTRTARRPRSATLRRRG